MSLRSFYKNLSSGFELSEMLAKGYKSPRSALEVREMFLCAVQKRVSLARQLRANLIESGMFPFVLSWT